MALFREELLEIIDNAQKEDAITLDLSSKVIKVLPEELGKLTKLESLSLDNNQLSALPESVGKLTKLESLSLNNNQLSALPESVGKLTKLESLSLDNNQLSALPESVGKLNKLQHLYLNNNQLSALPESVGKLTKLESLYLNNNQLSALPESVGKLNKLESLQIDNNQLNILPEFIGKLTNLRTLYVDTHLLSALPIFIEKLTNLEGLSLIGYQLNILPEFIGKLTKLKDLYLNDNQLSALPIFIEKLTNLENLYLDNNQLRALPEFVGKLTKLKSLSIDNNQLSALPESIGKLNKLQHLYLNNNQLSALPESVGKLNKLESLYLNNNQLSALPESVGKLTNLFSLYLTDNPLKSPPLEIAENGAGAMTSYFESLKDGEQTLSEVKLLFIGEGAAGKTSLVKQITGQKFNKKESQTHGINIRRWKPCENGQEASTANLSDETTLHFWDFGGQEIMHATHQFFLSSRSIYVLVLDGRKEENPEYWLKHVETFGGNSPIIIAINKIDENPGFDVNRNFLQEKYPNIRGFIRVSCATREGVDNLKQKIISLLPETPLYGSKWSTNWFNVKTRLENKRDNYITYDSYLSICKRCKVKDELSQNVLVDFLNDLGIILHFTDFDLKGTHVLNPRWVTEAVYKIINSKELADQGGVLQLSSLESILAQKKRGDYHYPPDKYRYIVELMKKFEICYEITDDTILVPDLLPVPQPDFEFEYTDSLRFVLKYEFLPPSVMPRFIVIMHNSISESLQWRTGVILEDRDFDARAVVILDSEDKRINMFVSGNQKRDYFAVLLFTLREINASFQKIDVTESMPLPDNSSVLVPYQHLITLEQKGVDTFLPQGSEKDYQVQELLGLVRSESNVEQRIFQLLNKMLKAEELKDEKKVGETLNKIVEFKPNFFGMGVNVNGLMDVYFNRKKKKRETD